MLLRKLFQMIAGSAFVYLGIVGQGTAGAQESKHGAKAPASIEAEHKELHEELAKAVRSGGRTAEAARNVEKLLQPHFVKEEQFGLPPLAVLADLAADKVPPNASDIIQMSDHLQQQMPTMLAEHAAIGKALERLRTAALEERKPAAVQFADNLMAHARQEEEVMYPAAILAGRYLKLKQR